MNQSWRRRAERELHSTDLFMEVDVITIIRFLLLYLHLETLAAHTTLEAFRSQLDCLALSLHGAYDQVMHRIQSLPPPELKLAHRALNWVTFSLRQLTALELQHAVAIESPHETMDEVSIPSLEHLVRTCAGLIMIDKATKCVSLVREYIKSRYHTDC